MKITRIIIPLFFLFLFSFHALGDGWWQVFFNHPNSKTGVTSETPEKALVKAINGAKTSFFAAFYDIDSVPVTQALVAAKKRGVNVRIVTDDSNYNNTQISQMLSAGIPVESDRRRELMHNKFAIIDNEKVWTGSYNVTANGENRNNNNAILIHSPELASIFTEEFNEMFELGIFGNKNEPGPFGGIGKKYYVKIGDTDINAYFAPEDDVENIIIGRIKKAKKSIRFMAFSFTSDEIGEAMIKKFKEGVAVSGLFETRGAKSKDSEFIKMKVEGIPVKLDSNKYAMHHKVIIIDDYRLITGSYNFSKNASRRNDENCLMIDNEAICGLYIKEFERLYKAGRAQ
ncbi:MAG: phospholipase D-like domain-containing protein [Spirochaetia bacterium]|jgi:phosphatidylserine/phosphatidylglycerophosphate/cardiolipin synthase-like enzyme|nr:phospholipase D-like domain-containing protein [Spirochaetia bacterium]